MHPQRALKLLIFILIIIVFNNYVFAGTYGFRLGACASNDKGVFKQYEAFAAKPLPWEWGSSSRVLLQSRLEWSTGMLSRKNEFGFFSSIGPNIILGLLKQRLSFETGSRIAILSEDHFGKTNYGGFYQFISHLAVTLRLNYFMAVSYRFQHMSNAGINDSNPGLNTNVFELNYSF